MSSFGAAECRYYVPYDQEMGRLIDHMAQADNFPAGLSGAREASLDHGCMVPLHFIAPRLQPGCRFLRIGISGLSPLEHYRLGMLLSRGIEALGRRACIVASGDLSHRLLAEGPYGFRPEGPAFDETVLQSLAQADFMQLLDIDPALSEAAGECGLRSFQIMAGAFEGCRAGTEILSYEGPYGVGYALAWLTPGEPDPERNIYEPQRQRQQQRIDQQRQGEDAWVSLARRSLEYRIRTGTELPLPPDLPAALLQQSAGVFVSLKKQGRLRGCIGTISPTQPSVAQEIIINAISAGLQDHRFAPVQADELDQLVYSVDVLTAPESISHSSQLDPQKYGVIVSRGSRRGLLLPMLEGVDSVEQQLAIALDKAGIQPDENYQLERFRVIRHH